SLVLLIGAGLFIGTLRNLRNHDPGFRSEGVLLADLDTPPPTPSVLLDEIRRVPGVVTASFSTHTPLSGSRWSEPAVPAGPPPPPPPTAPLLRPGPPLFRTPPAPPPAG